MNKLQVQGQVASVRGHHRAFAHRLWDTGALAGRHDDDEFATVTLRTHRHRRGPLDSDPDQSANDPADDPADDAALHAASALDVQTLNLHATGHALNYPDTAAGEVRLVCSGGECKLLQGISQCAPRDVLALVAAELQRLLVCKPLATAA